MLLRNWSTRWKIPDTALNELRMILTAVPEPDSPSIHASEAAAQVKVRLEASKRSWKLFRNNVGCLPDKRGIPIRFGLANDSKNMNMQLKSGDLIGIKPVAITAAMVGTVIGQFASLEVKKPGWVYTGNPHEQAQLRWIELITAMGGIASFSTGELP